MRHFYLLSMALFYCALHPAPVSAQCPVGQNEIRLEINSDQYYEEVHWTIKSSDGASTYVTGSIPDQDAHTYTYCIPDNGCTIFRITDDYGDGMEPDGVYRLYLNGALIHENVGGSYGTGESVNFGCPPGTTCESALPIDTGAWLTPNGSQIWYKFIPQDTGIYEINTCNPLNACGSKIWVYSQCFGVVITDNQTGADFYSEGGCDNGAVATALLAAGEDYYIRMRYEPAQCDTTPIHFTIKYNGPIVGCTDPLACNYEPLATVSGPCIYPGSPDCPTAPDLVTREDVYRSSLQFHTIQNADACAVEEGCIRGLGARNIISFSTYIENIGEQDYYIGHTPSDPNAPSTQFVWDPCHHHWHYLGYAEYVLYNSAGLRLPIGSKTGFCVLDLTCPTGHAQYTCSNMGISAGCADIYDSGLPCQWVDITDLPADDYTMVMRVNWDKSPDANGRIERDYNNNWAQACFHLSYSNNTPEVMFTNETCQPFTDCAGVVFGDAQPDCNGICNGPALHGDINQDTVRNDTDVENYLAMANADGGDASTCLDLDANGSLNVYDAALLMECTIHQDQPQYWIQKFPCQFPGGFTNDLDLVRILPGAVDTVAKTFDIQIVNPFNKIMGYEFSVSGLTIGSIENLAAGYEPNLRFNPSNNEIIGLGLTETSLSKNATPNNFLRIHYTSITGTEVCVSKVTAVVNSKYQLSNATLGTPNCVDIVTSGVNTPNNSAFAVYVQPNPFKESTTIFFENNAAEPMTVTVTDVTGKIVRHFEGIRDNAVTIERENLPAGSYMFTVSGAKGRVSGKIMAQ